MFDRPMRPRRLGVVSLATFAVAATVSLAGPVALMSSAQAATTGATAGTVFVTDENAGVVQQVAPDGTATPLGSFTEPDGLALDTAGNLYVANDTQGGTFDKLTPDGTQTALPITGFDYPWQIAVDNAGNVYAMGYTFNVGEHIVKLTPDGTQTDVSVPGSSSPEALATDSAGNLYVADYSNGVFKVTPDGTTTPFGSGYQEAEGVAVDEHDNVFVTDYAAHDIVKLTPDGTQTTIPLSSDFGPEAIATGPGGYLYVNNDDNGGTYQIDPSGAISLLSSQLSDYTYGIEAVQTRIGQSLAFDSSPGSAPFVGQAYDVSTHSGASGLPVTLSSATPGVCSVKSHLDGTGTAMLTGPGTCTVSAAQAGNRVYAPASAQQSFGVKFAQDIAFTSRAHKPRVGKTYHVTATGGTSANAVVFAKGARSHHNCTVTSAGKVKFKHAGRCTIVATQAGDATHYTAQRMFQTIRVRRAVQNVHFTTQAPKNAAAGTTYRAQATGGASGNKVKISVTGPCKVSPHGLVTFDAAGTCTISATQAGNADYLLGRAVQETKVH
jgi:streptogramin lyase